MKKFLFVILCSPILCASDCDQPQGTKQLAESDTGVKKATAKIVTDPDGHTIEQNNVIKRLEMDNKPGSIKHLYVVSAMSGQVLIYSTVKGKVTSSGKRLTPGTVRGYASSSTWAQPMAVTINNQGYWTEEVIQDDGTYGSSIEYIYWFDVRGAYHQHYLTGGGQILHISDQPIAVKDVVLNLENINK